MHPTQSSDAPFLVVVPSTLVLQQPGPGCDEGTCMELCAGMVPMRDVKRPGPSLVYPLRPAGTFWQAHSLGIIDRSSHGCLANRFRRLGELALTILSLAPVQHWRRERRRVDIQSCWERRRKQRIGRHGGRWALTSCPSEFASTPPISWRAACLRRRRRRTRQQPSRSRSTAPPPATRRVKEGLRLSVRKPLCDGCDGRCRESRDSPYLMVYTTGSRDKAEKIL